MRGPIEYLDRAVASFDGDPPDSDFQRGYLEALKAVRSEAFPPIENAFAKLFYTPHGQLLVFKDETDEGDPALCIIGADVRGVTPKARPSWTTEDKQRAAFEKYDQAIADEQAAALNALAHKYAPEEQSA